MSLETWNNWLQLVSALLLGLTFIVGAATIGTGYFLQKQLNARLDAISKRQDFRRLSFEMDAFKAALRGSPPTKVEIWYRPEDDEANFFATYLGAGLASVGWTAAWAVPIPPDAVAGHLRELPVAMRSHLTALARVGAQPTGVSIFAKSGNIAHAAAPTKPAEFLVRALRAGGTGPIWFTEDENFPEDSLRLIVALKP